MGQEEDGGVVGTEAGTGGVGGRKVVFNKYEMGRLLGKGTFAKVYYAKHLATGESVAIKVINKDHVKREPGMVAQIVREISIMRLVRHPHVVELREVMATKSRIFFVMEYVRGGELFARVSRGKLREDEARRYFQQLVSAIDFCHSRGVFHRDLKPENLLLDDAGDLKVSDFGLSALPEQFRHDGLLHTQCGTPAYVAPEVLRKKGYEGARADLWSCGVILYVLLAGFLPFQDENLMRLYRKVFKGEYEFPPWFSTGARRLISRLLVADPKKRITVPEIMQDPWFRKGFSHPVAFSIPEPTGGAAALTAALEAEGTVGGEDKRKEEPETLPGAVAEAKSPAFYNAFELISAMSSGFDLSGLFEESRSPRRRAGSVFTSRWSAVAIAERLERVGRALGFGVKRGAKEDDSNPYKLRLEGRGEGRKGRLAVTAEVFEVAPQVLVVEFCKSAGDTLEYVKFCEADVRPGLKDIVWTWQGEGCKASGNGAAVAATATANGCCCGSGI